MLPLVCFVRQGDVSRVQETLALKETDVNAMCFVTVRFVEPRGTPQAYAPHEVEVRARALGSCAARITVIMLLSAGSIVSIPCAV